MQGGNEKAQGLGPPEVPAKYPESGMFGPLPAYGLYCRHVEGLTVRNVQTRWRQPDLRPALVFDDVKTLDLDAFKTDTVAGSEPLVWLNRVTDAFIHGSHVPVTADRFLRTTQTKEGGVRTAANDTK